MKRVTSYSRSPQSGVTQTQTQQYVAYINTPFGSDSIARLREAGEPVSELLKQALKLVPYGGETRIRSEREYGLQKRPGQAERTALATRKAPSVEQTAEIAWAVGSSTSQTVVELNPPYVSDDRIVKTNGVYSVQASNAEAQSLAYARIENRLLLANRNGCGIQLQPLHTPPKPFDLIYIRLNGATGCYRVNGTTWTIGADGAVCTIDALFWGAIDGAVGDAWFPLPPGVSSLPATAAVTTNANPVPANAIAIPSGFNFTSPNLGSLFSSLPYGQAPIYGAVINPAQIVRPYHETVELQGGVQVGGSVEVQTWLPTELELEGGVAVGGSVLAIDTLLEVLPAQLVLQPRTVTMVEGDGISVLQVTPGQLVLQPRAMNLIDVASTTELLLQMEGTGSTFVDSSVNAHAVTTLGTVSQSTAQAKWDAKSAEFDGTGGAICVAGTEFTIAASEPLSMSFWLRPQSWVGGQGRRRVFTLGQSNTGDLHIEVGLTGSVAYIVLTNYPSTGEYRYATIPLNEWAYVKLVRETGGLRRFAVNGVESFAYDSYLGIEEVYDTNAYTDGIRIGSTDAELQQGIGLIGNVDHFRFERIASSIIDLPQADDQTIASTDLLRLFPARLALQPKLITLNDELAINTLEIATARLVLQPKPITLAESGGSTTAVLLEMEGSGSSFVDTSGNGNVVTTSGTVTQSTAQAKWGSKSAEFNGNGGAVIVAGSGFPIAAGDPFSLGLYVRPGTSAQQQSRCLFLMQAANGAFFMLSLIPQSNQTQCAVLLEAFDGNLTTDYRFAIVSANAWAYVKVVREANGTRKYAVNGTEILYVDSYDGVVPVIDSNAYTSGFRVGSTVQQVQFGTGILADVDHVRLELAATSITEVPTGP